jgi:hypothetical protein
MAASTHYPDYVAFVFVACPALLFDEPALEVLRAATSHRALVTIHRDIVSCAFLCFLLFVLIVCLNTVAECAYGIGEN